MKKLIENYGRPTPPFWRKVGDFALFLIPILEAQWLALPEAVSVDPLVKWSITTLLIVFKAWTNTRVDNNHYGI